MDYKKIFKSQKLRFRILKSLSFIDDKTMIKLQYRIKHGVKLNINKPVRYTEKLQWYKLYYRDPLMTKCADKYLVREYVQSKGLGHLLNELYGVWDNAEYIDFNTLPNSFVLKTTNGSGTNILVEDKSILNVEDTKRQLNEWLNREKISAGREWAYDHIQPKIIAEKFLDLDENKDLPDYKIFTFNGKVDCLYVIVERFFENGGKAAFYDPGFNRIKYNRTEYSQLDYELKKPKNFNKMLEYAELLSQDFPHVRVDFYNINGKITFGELTFYESSGYTKYTPDDFEYEMGKKFVLPQKKNGYKR